MKIWKQMHDKKKRKLISGLMVLALALISATPVAAATANEVQGKEFMTVGESLHLEEAYLVIQDNRGHLGNDAHTIRLSLENGQWAPVSDWKTEDFRYYHEEKLVAPGSKEAVTVNRVTDTRLQVTFTMNEAKVGEKSDEIHIPLLLSVPESGEATLTLDHLNTPVSPGSYVVVTAVTERVRLTVEDPVTFGPQEQAILPVMQMEELRQGTINPSEKWVFTLPRGFTWVANTPVTFEGSGGFSGEGTYLVTEEAINDRQLSLSPAQAGIRRQGEKRGRITLKGVSIQGSQEVFGEVSLRVSGPLPTQEITVALHQDFSLQVRGEGLEKKILSGRFYQGHQGRLVDGGQPLRTLVVEEVVPGSLIAERPIDITFSPEVKILAIQGIEPEGFTPGDHGLTWRPKAVKTDEKRSYKMVLEVMTSPQFEGDIMASLTGGGLPPETLLNLGSATVPVLVEGEVVSWHPAAGMQTPPLTVVETLPGAVMKGDLQVSLGVGEWQEVPPVKVTLGDLQVGEPSIEKNHLLIPVTRDSSQPAAITIGSSGVKGLENAALGTANITLGGSALIDPQVESLWNREGYQTMPLIRLVSEGGVIFKVNQPYYQVGSQQIPIDIPPFIDNGRLMVPVAHVARGLGISSEAVVWNGAEKSVTMTAGDVEVKMIVGQREIWVNGEAQDMGAEAAMVDNRTVVPLSRFARALQKQYTWDEQAQTVTFD